VNYGIDMRPLIKDKNLSIKEFALSYVEDLRNEISNELGKLE
jgi:hypothetical protein